MIDDIILYFQNNKRARNLVITITALLLAFLAIVFLVSNKHFKQYSLTNANIKLSDNYGFLEGDNIYSYNGLSFYRVKVNSKDEPEVLSTGLRLPEVDTLHWADNKGAMLTFKSSPYGTVIEDKLKSLNEKLSLNTNKYVWYLDFSTSELSLVSKDPLYLDLAHYSSKLNKLFYIAENTDPEQKGEVSGYPIKAFDISSLTSSDVSYPLGLTGLSNLSDCPEGKGNVCIIGRDINNTTEQTVFAVDDSNNKTKLLSSETPILPTNRSDIYITVKKDPKKSSSKDEIDAYSQKGEAVAHSLLDNSSGPLGFDISTEGFVLTFNSDNTFYSLDNIFTDQKYGSDKNQVGQPYIYKSGDFNSNKLSQKSKNYIANIGNEDFKLKIISSSGQNENGVSLLNSYDGKQLVFSNLESFEGTSLETKSENEAKNSIKECLSNLTGSSYQYFSDSKKFKVYFNEGDSLNNDIQKFSDCMKIKYPKVQHGYNFYLGTTDPQSGRITSN